jgi:3',5'-cyclic AMP phosphodiesterase CpdA
MRRIDDVAQKTRGKTVIAHISDLHFEANTVANDWVCQALQNDLQKAQPDMLFVTGDLIDSSVGDSLWGNAMTIRKALTNVRTYVEALCQLLCLEPEKSLFVIPGNHDYRLKGLIQRNAQADSFYEEFRKYSEARVIPNLNSVVFTFDSNSTDTGVNFATGLVSRERFTEFEKSVEDLRKDKGSGWYDCARIALLHHHPMPIAPTEERLAITDREEFLLLKNAGSFMEQMARAEIDLIFHGHKHYPSLSKAVFPKQGIADQSIAVIAAGSARKPPGQFPRSFNIVKICNTGEITLERRVLKSTAYETLDVLTVRSYEEARNARYFDLAKRHGGRIQATKYLRCDYIEDGSGDDVMYEEFRGVRSINEDLVESVEHEMSSRSGRFGDRSYSVQTPNQSVEWEWCDEPETQGKRRAKTLFMPPLGKDRIDFSRRGTIHNAIHFSQADRLAVTGQTSHTEHVSLAFRHAYESFAFQVMFPDNQWPENFKLSVRDESGEPDYREREYCAGFFTPIPHTRSVVLTIDRPLASYTYKIEWDLPKEDRADRLPRAQDAALAQELVERLLAAREVGSPYREPLRAALASLSAVVRKLLTRTNSDADMEITVYSYDKQKGGLVCVAAHGFSGPQDELWSAVTTLGRRIDGQAYRRREALLFVDVPGVTSNTAVYYERTKGCDPHTVLFATPLFYPLGTGRKIAVVSFASRSNTSELLMLQSDEAVLIELVEQTNAWFAVDAAVALGFDQFLGTDSDDSA